MSSLQTLPMPKAKAPAIAKAMPKAKAQAKAMPKAKAPAIALPLAKGKDGRRIAGDHAQHPRARAGEDGREGCVKTRGNVCVGRAGRPCGQPSVQLRRVCQRAISLMYQTVSHCQTLCMWRRVKTVLGAVFGGCGVLQTA